MYIENHMVKEKRRETDNIFFSIYLSVSFVHVLDKHMEHLPDFPTFYNMGQCSTDAPNNCNLASHFTCFCGYSQ